MRSMTLKISLHGKAGAWAYLVPWETPLSSQKARARVQAHSLFKETLTPNSPSKRALLQGINLSELKSILFFSYFYPRGCTLPFMACLLHHHPFSECSCVAVSVLRSQVPGDGFPTWQPPVAETGPVEEKMPFPWGPGQKSNQIKGPHTQLWWMAPLEPAH